MYGLLYICKINQESGIQQEPILYFYISPLVYSSQKIIPEKWI